MEARFMTGRTPKETDRNENWTVRILTGER